MELSFGIETSKTETELINLYTENNKIYDKNTIVYGCIFNNTDYHKPILCEIKIIDYIIDTAMNINYFFKIIDIHETPIIIDKFVNGKEFIIYKLDGDNKKSKKVYINLHTKINDFIFKQHGFFIRENLDEINKIIKAYIKTAEIDLKQMINDIGEN